MRAARIFLVGAIVFAGAAMSGRAYAIIRSTGQGSTSVRLESTFTVRVDGSTGNVAGQRLHPGGQTSVSATLRNSNTVPVVVDTVTIGAPTSGKEGCDGSTITVALAGPLDTVTPLAPDEPRVIDFTVTMSTEAPSACQGASFSIPVAVKVKR